MRGLGACGRKGLAVLPIVAWMLAAASIWLAAGAWLGPGAPGDATVSGRASQEERTLQLALSTTRGQNAALRTELDRLLTSSQLTAGDGAPAVGTPQAAAAESATEPEQRELTGRIRDTVTRAARAGDPESNKQAALSLMEAFRQGEDGFGPLHDAYLAAEDPKAREIMIPTILFIGREKARDFLIDQLQQETDPELRKMLLKQSVRYASPDQVGRLQGSYLAALRSDDPEMRAWAVRGLRYAKGKDAQEALAAALGDPDEGTRIAAIANLASRPQMRARIRQITSRETGLVREIADCSLLVNDSSR